MSVITKVEADVEAVVAFVERELGFTKATVAADEAKVATTVEAHPAEAAVAAVVVAPVATAAVAVAAAAVTTTK